jgi:hypothetical protein
MIALRKYLVAGMILLAILVDALIFGDLTNTVAKLAGN